MSRPEPAPAWTVTLVCGASGVGKSHVAEALARRYGVPLAPVDDVVTAIMALTTPEQFPVLHRWNTDPAARRWTPERIVGHTLAVADALRPGLEAVVADHLESAAPVVLEGDHLLPDLAAHRGHAVRTVVVSEPDEARIRANYAAREPGAGPQRRRATVSALLDAELTRRAAAVGVPVVPARPWADAVDRVDAALRRA